jgi:hypothetical protein
MKSTHDDNFEKLVDEWAAADKECGRLYILWNEACQRRQRLARAKNRAWHETTAAKANANQ